ncbi:hypothetical protein [Nocardia puris]|uniref:Uncharacterized protein n=1 Tax=Nocardia puris TaxID=208602 RepID=A0A366DB40_9NOCA|nr:hypothetical protein [Nocardia puris]RBO86468.1 hypothetical protein DFR74_11310 [Nocardia puris]
MAYASCWLLTGTWHARYRQPGHNLPGDTMFRVLPVTARPGYATALVNWDDTSRQHTIYRHAGLRTLERFDTTGVEGSVQHDVMPLAVVAADLRQRSWVVYAPSRLTTEAGLFHRVTEITHAFTFAEIDSATTTEPSAEVLAEVVDRLPEFSARVGSHECWYHTIDAGVEYEHKFTLDPDTDIYTLTRGIAAEIGRGEPAYLRPEFANAFEMWQFHNYMFEVTGPTSADCGYASFIPRRAGGHVIKRKRFAHDGFARYETKTTVTEELTDTAQMLSYLHQHLGLEAIYLGEFIRTRFDNNVESVNTGHIYSIMADRCEFPEHPGTVLQQLEIEYLRSRGSERDSRREMIDELGSIRHWTSQHLADHTIPAKPSYLSKYTFLRRLTFPGPPRATERT